MTNLAFVLNALGLKYYKQENWPKAVELFEKAWMASAAPARARPIPTPSL